MRVTVCELRNDPAALEEDWRSLATVEIDLAVADVAKSTYPRYVTDPRSPDLY